MAGPAVEAGAFHGPGRRVSAGLRRIPLAVGDWIFTRILDAADAATLAADIFRALAHPRLYVGPTFRQCYEIGVKSVGIVIVMGIVSGGLLSQSTGYTASGIMPMWVVGSLITAAALTEVGPVVTALVLVGRVGARIGSELGTMAVSEQLDAYRALGRDPVVDLVVPRVLAGILTFPLLVLVADLVSLVTGYAGALLTLPLNSQEFVHGARMYFHDFALWFGLIKGGVFGGTITFIGCYMGMRSAGGAEGVGRTTTATVVISTIVIMLWDLILVQLLKKFG